MVLRLIRKEDSSKTDTLINQLISHLDSSGYKIKIIKSV